MASRGGANLLRVRSEFDDKLSSPLDRVRDKFDQLGKSKGAKAVLQGVGMGAGIAAWGLLQRAIGGAVGMLGESIQMAKDEQVGIAKLDQALAANIAGWDGNRQAIEAVIAQREKLAFSDEIGRAHV